jgi:hypothetical protein
MTKEDFEKRYAMRSGLTVERIRGYGLYPESCECGDESCQGWWPKGKKPLPDARKVGLWLKRATPTGAVRTINDFRFKRGIGPLKEGWK